MSIPFAIEIARTLILDLAPGVVVQGDSATFISAMLGKACEADSLAKAKVSGTMCFGIPPWSWSRFAVGCVSLCVPFPSQDLWLAAPL